MVDAVRTHLVAISVAEGFNAMPNQGQFCHCIVSQQRDKIFRIFSVCFFGVSAVLDQDVFDILGHYQS
jgi:hypothetical protein